MNRYRLFRAGDLNAFFALMFDNVANLVILVAILVGAFHFPGRSFSIGWSRARPWACSSGT